jgi:hypothetical protein
MADQRITQLTQLSEADVAAIDVLPIVDISASETKKVTAKDLFEAGATLADSSSIDLVKLNQSSVTKLGTTALADDAITAAKLADDSSIHYGPTAPVSDNFEGRGHLDSATSYLSIWDGSAFQQVIAPTAGIEDLAVTTGKLADNAVTTAKVDALGLDTAALADSAVTTAKIADDAVTVDKIGAGAVDTTALASDAVTTIKVADDAITYTKIQNVSDTDKLLGRSSAGAGDVEEIACTSAGRALLDDADAAAQRTTLGLGTLATQDGTFSGTHSGTTSGTNTGDQTITLTGDVTGTGTGSFAASIATDAVTTAKIATGAVTTDELGAASVTGPKLAADSSTVVSGNAPSGSGDFEGQGWINTNTGLNYVWTGAAWQQVAALQTITFSDTTPLTFSVTKPDNFSATITTTLDTQTAGTVFAGPTTGSAASPTFRALAATDLPIAVSGTNGAVQPGTGLTVTGAGVLNHTNSAATGTFTKVTIDAQGHVTTGATLNAADIPSLDASKITTGTFNSAFLSENSVTAQQLADYGIAQVSETAPTPEFAGQWWINPSDRSAYIWVGTVAPTPNGYWLLVGYGSPTQLNLRFGGTYNATSNTVVSLNQYGVEAGLVIGQALTAPNPQNNGVYLIVTTAGTGTTPAPVASLAAGDWVLSQGTGANWTKIAVVSGATGTFNDYDILSDGTYFTPDMTGVTDVRDALVLLWGRAQIATTSQIGVVLESTEVLVDNSTGEMTIGVVDDGTY